ncbi:(2Fe-2S)-binding protein [Roseibium sp.]|uniref:(2Fe-2S)-binding protein n=1 Tax=Roseibium sp. TaxID=1936156 RepID=UPI003D0F2496
MKTVSTFRDLKPAGRLVRVRFAGQELELREGGNLAAELLAAGVQPLRVTPVSGAPRNPYCMMGACFDCLVVIDGVTRQACMSEVSDGMEISMHGAGSGSDA